MKKLEVGSVIFKRHYSKIEMVGMIDRVTNNIAYIGNSVKFRRDYNEDSKSVSIIPSTFSSAWYFIPNETDVLDFKKQSVIDFVVNFDYNKLSYDKICDIKDIIKRTEL